MLAIDLARHVAARAVHGRERAVGVIFRLIEHRGVGQIGAADDLGEHVLPSLVATLLASARLLQADPFFHEPGQALLAVADDEEIDEGSQHFRILRARAAGDDQRMIERALVRSAAECRRDRAWSGCSCSRPRIAG